MFGHWINPEIKLEIMNDYNYYDLWFVLCLSLLDSVDRRELIGMLTKTWVWEKWWEFPLIHFQTAATAATMAVSQNHQLLRTSPPEAETSALKVSLDWPSCCQPHISWEREDNFTNVEVSYREALRLWGMKDYFQVIKLSDNLSCHFPFSWLLWWLLDFPTMVQFVMRFLLWLHFFFGFLVFPPCLFRLLCDSHF